MRWLTAPENQIFIHNHPNKFILYGAKTFSQADEDGLTLEIINRINPTNKTYLELGVGNGTENNTMVLKALKWNGQWIDNQDLAFAHENYTKAFITAENILDLINVSPSLVSIDLDGMDYYILQKILTKHTPDVLILEYNSAFIPPIEFIPFYNPQHVWDGSTYYGASIQSFVNLLTDYTLVACNGATGCNAFFVLNKHKNLFPEIKGLSLRDIYIQPRFFEGGRHPHGPHTFNVYL